ncbi:MAG: Ig-like domain-containing protein [Gemmatimonadaceae bacterium]|nr:Ig-like domain-containing protein [Gemmatimonadaceae bacterium]
MLQCADAAAQACSSSIAAADSIQRLTLRLRLTNNGNPVSDAVVRVRATSGFVVGDSARTDTDGRVHATWLREGGATAVGISAVASASVGSATFDLTLMPRKTDRGKLILEAWEDHTQSWFEKTTVPGVIDVRIARVLKSDTLEITDPAECAAHRVHFIRFGGNGSATPDTSTGSVWEVPLHRGDTKTTSVCFAWTRWTLGEGVGNRTLRVGATPQGGVTAPQPIEVFAHARPLPRFVAGVAGLPIRAYNGVRSAPARTIRVERTLVDGSTIAYDSVVAGAKTVDRVGKKTSVAAIGGVTFALPIGRLAERGWDFAAVSFGVSLQAPRDEWFVAVPLLRWVLRDESLPLDIQAVGSWARRETVRDLAACQSVGDCETRPQRRFQGIGWMLTADASTVLAELVKRLAP